MLNRILTTFGLSYAVIQSLFSGWYWILAPNALFFFALHLTATTLFVTSLNTVSIKPPLNLRLFCGAIFLLVPFVGSVGAFALWLSFAIRPAQDQRAMEELTSSLESEENQFVDLSLQLVSQNIEHNKTGKKVQAAPDAYADILRSNNLEAKKQVISELRHARTPNLIALLKIAQKDPHYDIQYLASTALSKIEKAWHDEIRELSEALELQPNNTEIRNNIVEIYMLIHGSGMVPPSIARVYLRHALQHAVISLQFKTNQPNLLFYLGKIHLIMGNYSQAYEAFTKAIQIDPKIPNYRIYRAEAAYQLKQYDKIRIDCENVNVEALIYLKVQPNVAFWTENNQ